MIKAQLFLAAQTKHKLHTIRQHPVHQQEEQGGDRCHNKHCHGGSAGFSPRSPGNTVNFLADLSYKLCGRHFSHRVLPIQVQKRSVQDHACCHRKIQFWDKIKAPSPSKNRGGYHHLSALDELPWDGLLSKPLRDGNNLSQFRPQKRCRRPHH